MGSNLTRALHILAFIMSLYAPQMVRANPLIKILTERRNLVSNWVSECKTPQRLSEISDFHNKCLQKDTLSWAGYTCFAATLAQDGHNSFKRCNDVKNSQGLNGRWWRGPGVVDIETKDSFSRDMSLGLASWLLIKTESKKEAFIKWLNWIEKHGSGKMCKDSSDNRCEIKANQKEIFKALLDEYKINESSVKDYNVVKKFNEGYSFNLWSIETNFTPVDYQLHLKSIELLILKRLKKISDQDYLEIARKIYEKDPLNAYYEYLYKGISARLVDRVLNLCPSTRNLQKTLRHGYGGDWTWQRNSKERSWEIASGHDCIFLINLIIAELNGNFNLPRVQAKSDCPLTSKKLGTFEGFPICTPLIPNKINLAECKNQTPTQWSDGDKQWCLHFKSGRWNAEIIERTCPKNFNNLPDKNNYIVCEKSSEDKIRLSECISDYQSITSEKLSPNSNPQWCFLNKGQWYERKKITGTCPVGLEFKNAYVWDIWPVCQSLIRSKSKCQGAWDKIVEDKCWEQKKGWFEVRELE